MYYNNIKLFGYKLNKVEILILSLFFYYARTISIKLHFKHILNIHFCSSKIKTINNRLIRIYV